MSDPHPSLGSEELVRHAEFVRRLARGLLGDEARGDDVAQASLLAALERPPAHASQPRAWLARVTRNAAHKLVRGERRRGERERAVARPEALASADAVVEQVEVLRAVTAAVLALEEPYRRVVLARYYEGLELAEVAAREGAPLATVRSRHTRALARLRVRLDRAHGERRESWAVALAGLAGLRQVELGSGVGAGAIVMGTQAKLAAGLAVALVLAAHFALRTPPAAPAPRAALPGSELSGVASASASSSPTPLLSIADTGRPQEQREALAIAPNDARASLRVSLRWADTTPAAGVHVRLIEWAHPVARLHDRFGVTDERGALEWDDVQPGGVTVEVDRGGGGSFEVQPGRKNEVALDIPSGLEVRGVVRDLRGVPQPGATIWLSPYANPHGSAPVAVADNQGRFVLRDVENDHYVAARSAGLAPSPAFQVAGSVGDVRELELVLQGPGAALAMRILDRDGTPLQDVRVRVSERRSPAGYVGVPEGTHLADALTFDGMSDSGGRVAFDSLPAATVDWIASGEGHAAVWGFAALETGARRELEVRLGPGATIEGRVSDAQGAPVQGAVVSVGAFGDLDRREATSGPDGRYRLLHATHHRDGIHARHRASGATAKLERDLRDGERVHWDPVLDRGRIVRGRLIDARGAPLAGWVVNAHAMHPSTLEAATFGGQRETAEDGTFAIARCPNAALRLGVVQKSHMTEPAQVTFEDVLADGLARDYVVPDASDPTASVRGLLRLADGSPAALRVVVRRDDGGWGRNVWADIATGAFDLYGIVPGAYTLSADDGRGLAITPFEVELDPHEVLELGALVAGGPAPFSAALLPVEGIDLSMVRLSILTDRRMLVRDATAGELLAGVELLPGRYLLQLNGPCVPDALPFAVRPGQSGHLDVTPRPFVLITLDHRLPDGTELPLELEVTFRDPAGVIARHDRVRLDQRSNPPTGRESLSFHQAPVGLGYAVEVTTDRGLGGSVWIDTQDLVADGSGSLAPVRVELR